MALTIHDTLTGEKRPFVPREKGRVSMYVCGPTVYDEAHIGHARGAFVFDVVRNYFIYKGYEVIFVRNVTDIDDKIIQRARDAEERQSEDEIKKRAGDIAGTYYTRYCQDMRALGIGTPTHEPRATEHIQDMLRIIRVLMDKGYAYEAGGDIYFRVRKFAPYGKLSHQSIEHLVSGARIEKGEMKEDPLDFALWKKSKPDEPSWKDGDIEGRPGWHIECSAMSQQHLGTTFDIHGGGIDLIFPHHENEIAQSEAATGVRFAEYWMHNGLLTIRGQKMAKSAGNYLSIRDFLKEYKDPDILKFFFLSAHYRTPLDFTAETIGQARAQKERVTGFLVRADDYITGAGLDTVNDNEKQRRIRALWDDPSRDADIGEKEGLNKKTDTPWSLPAQFESAMDDDFNTPAALAALLTTVNYGNSFLEASHAEDGAWRPWVIAALAGKIRELAGILDLSLSGKKVSEEFSRKVEKKIEARNAARKAKDFKTADAIREELSEWGILLEDTATGTRWRVA